MKKIKVTIGILSFVLGFFGSLYVGGWCMFIQPIINACKAFDAGTITGLIVGTTIIKCVFAGCVGSLIFVIGYYLGMFLIFADD